MNKETLRIYLSNHYQGYDSFIKEIIIPMFGEDNFTDNSHTEMLVSNVELRHQAQAVGINSVKNLGEVELDFDSKLIIYDVTVTDHVRLERNRVKTQELVRRMIAFFDSAFMIFHYEDGSRWDWRFTFCYKSTDKNETTSAKRYTFLLGPGQACRTAAENFQRLLDKHGDIRQKDIEQAFDVEALSNEFFDKYKWHYERFVHYVTGKRFEKQGGKYIEKDYHDGDKEMYVAFGRNDKKVRDYVKKLLGRIVFLHFLQKKGWLGVPRDAEWGEGDPQFMKHLYEHATEEQRENYLDEVLEPLFDKGLDAPRTDDLFDTHVALDGGSVVKIPYLNGGLFVRDELDEIPTKFPKDFFGDLLEFFYQYNFTIDENDPNEAEVGVDPEMLGRIFENLLEDNKDKGAYYTPKEIVQYMCRESLTSYLLTDVGDEAQRTAVAQFIKTKEAALLGDHKEEVDEKLRDVKILDPAIGSGAFPMGLLREIYGCRSAIEEAEEPAEVKRQIIQHNIYGVDIEKGAVDIARLRFWLSLVVDEQTPETLPNLDYKIMQGSSLLEQYQGVDLSTLTKKKNEANGEAQWTFYDDMVDDTRRKLTELLDDYYNCSDHVRKAEIHEKIAENVKRQLAEQGINVDFGKLDLSGNDQFFLWHTWFNDVFREGGFDIVIGNPPYVEAKKLKYIASTLKPLFKVYSGTADFSVYFIEQGLNLLADKGTLCLITTNKFFNTGYGKKVRQLIASEQINAIINFEQVEVFKDVLVSSVILDVQKQTPKEGNAFTFAQFYKLGYEEFKTEFSRRMDDFGSYQQKYLDENEWSFADMTELTLKEKIEDGTTRLENVSGINIYRGVTTGYNPAFIISNAKRDELLAEDPKNADVIKNMLQGRNIRKWYYNESDENLIFIPWHFPMHEDESITGCSLEAETLFKDKYPSLYAFLSLHKEKLSERNKEETGIRYEWYALQRCAASYSSEFEKPEKVIWGLTANKWAFAYDDQQHYLPSNGYILTSTNIPIKYLLGWLNSKLMHYYFSFIGVMTAGGAYTLKAASISALPYKAPSDYQPIIDLVDAILSAKRVDPAADTSAEERTIDQLVYQLYGLTPDEIAMVEQGASK